MTPGVSFPPAPPGETPDEAAVRKAFEDFYTVYDTYLKNPDLTDMTEVDRVTMPGTEGPDVVRDLIGHFRENKKFTTGVRKFRNVAITFEEPDWSIVTYCHDVSATQVMTEGSSTPEEPLTPTAVETMYIEKGENGVWRTAGFRNKEASC